MQNSASDQKPTAEHADGSLSARLLAPSTFPHLVADTKTLITTEIKKKGITLRTGFNVVQKAKPDLVDRTVRELMPKFVHELEPMYSDFRAQGGNDFRAYLVAHDQQVADAMLSVADHRAESIYNRTIRSAYDRLRGRAHRELVDATPGLAAVLARHAQ